MHNWNLSQSELELTRRPLHQIKYPRYLLKNIIGANGKTFGLLCYHPKRAQCFEAIKIWTTSRDNSDLEQEEKRQKMKIGDISNTGILKRGNSFPEKKVWIFHLQKKILHCFRRKRANYLEQLGNRYGC